MLKISTAMILVLASAITVLAILPAPPQFDEWELVAKLCGRLEQIERVPDKGAPGAYSDKPRPITNAKLVAYEARSNSECCENARVAGETTSNKSGAFEFKGLAKGYYWLVTNIGTQDYKMAIRVGQLQDRQPVCSQLSFAIDTYGEFGLRVRAPGR